MRGARGSEHGRRERSVDGAHMNLHQRTRLLSLAFTRSLFCSRVCVCVRAALPSIPPHWSASPEGFSFQYLLSDGTRLVIKSIRMDRALIVHGAKKGDKAAVKTVDINVDEYVNAASFPAAAAASGSAASINFSTLFRDLPALLSVYDNGVLNPLLPKPAAAAAGDSSQKVGVSSQPQPQPDFDPLLVPPRNQPPPRNPLIDDDPSNNPYLRDPFNRPRPGGDFAGDLDPLVGGGPNSGNLLGPRNFPGVGGQQPGMPGMPRVPGMAPRFDPYGPAPGMGEPDFDELPPPGIGGPGFGPGRLGGQPRRGGFGGGFGGMDPRGGGPGGFPGGGFH